MLKNRFLLLAVVVAFLTVGCSPTVAPPIETDFTLPTLNGQTFTLSDYRGQPIVLSFFSTRCSACQREIPHLISLYQKYQDSHQLLVVGIAVNVISEQTVEDFVSEMEISYPILLDWEEEVANQFGVRYIPHCVFIDQELNPVGDPLVGYHSEEELEERLAELW